MTTYQNNPKSIPDWKPIKKPAELAESRVMEAILDGTFPINSHLPGERSLAESLGVTRPTLREALQRLERDGWVEIQQGKSTRIRDYWQEGKLGVLNALSRYPGQLPPDFIQHLLTVRVAMAPTYTALAIQAAPDAILGVLGSHPQASETPQQFSRFDWELQHQLTLLSQNTVFTLILNSFKDLFLKLAPFYFQQSDARAHSAYYYDDLAAAVADHDAEKGAQLTRSIMRESLNFWQKTQIT